MSESILSLRLQPSPDGSPRGRRAIGNIYPLDKDAPLASARRDIVIPVSSESTDALQVRTTPGSYLIECVLPSGAMLTSHASLNEGELKEVILGEDISQSESQPRFRARTATSAYPRDDASEHWNLKVVSNAIGAAIDSKEARAALDYFGTMLGDKLIEVTSVPESFSFKGKRGWMTRFYLINLFRPLIDVMEWWPVYAGREITFISKGQPKFQTEYFDRQFFSIEASPIEEFDVRQFVKWTPEGVELISLPSRWKQIINYSEANFESACDTSAESRRFRSSISVGDPYFSTIFSYLSSGSLPQAERILQEAEEMLYEKFSNPYAAAAGAYLLINRGEPKREAHWPGWLENLYRSFPWLSDGAVAYGWLQLALGNNEQAKRSFLEAYSRGVPLFSLGVRKLMEGLQMFGADPACEEIARIVQVTAMRTNMNECFTVTLLGPQNGLTRTYKKHERDI